MKQIPVFLPPLPEQHQIVAKIEALFSELDNAVENLKKAKAQVKTYRQAVLKDAFEGKLTEEWRKSNFAKASLDKKENVGVSLAAEGKADYLVSGSLPDSWEWIKSGSLFDFVTSGSRGWAKYYSDSGALFIRITNLDFDTLKLNLNESKLKYVNPPTNSEGMRTKIQKGDFLFSITGYLGMFAIAPNLKDAYVNQHIGLCRPKDGFNKRYVGYWIISETGGIHHLNKYKKGAVKAGLNLVDLKIFPVPLAPIEEQNAIVHEIETRFSVADNLEQSINRSLIQAEALRQSILKKAFEGRLV